MELKFELNGKKIATVVEADSLLLDALRSLGCASVKRGCESSNCGLCTVFVDDKPVLSCSVLAARVSGRKVTTLEGLQDEAADFGAFIPHPTEEEILSYLSGNLCRCSGYEGQLRGIQSYLAFKDAQKKGGV